MIEKPNVYSRRVQKALRINEAESILLRERLECLETQRRLAVLRTENRQRSLRSVLRSIRQCTGTLFPTEPDPEQHAAVTFFMYGAPVERTSRTLRYPAHPGQDTGEKGDAKVSNLARQSSCMPCRSLSHDSGVRGSCPCRCKPLRLPELPRAQPGFSVYFSEMSVASSSPTPSSDYRRKTPSVTMPAIRRR